MSAVETACTYDCPDACALLVERRDGEMNLRGHPDHPITRGFVCRRVRNHPGRLRSPQRITRPLQRQGSSFQEIDWDRALDLVAAGLERALQETPASVVLVPGGGSLGLRKLLVDHFFHSLGPITRLGGGVCDETGAAAQRLDFGDKCAHDYSDLENTGAIVLWGRNPAVGAVHLVPFIKQARRRGCPVVLIDLWPNQSRALADRFIRVRPGADAQLAQAVLKLLDADGRLSAAAAARCQGVYELRTLLEATSLAELVSACGVELADVEYLAGLYAGGPVATHIGWGLQRRSSGGLAIRWIDALCALSGQVGTSGGGASYNPGRRRGLDTSLLARPSGRVVEASRFAEQLAALVDPPAHFVYLYGVNAVSQFADSQAVAAALRGAGLVVVAEAFLTDTAACADLVLPVSLMLEDEYDLVGSYGHHWVARARRAVDPPAGVKEDVEIVRLVRRRLGLADDPLLEDVAATLERMSRPWFNGDEPFTRNPCQPPVPFAERFATASGKVQLVGERPPAPPRPDPRYPLLLLSPKRRRFAHSQIPPGEMERPWPCLLNPRAPGLDEIPPGSRVRLVGELGAMEVKLLFREDLPRDLCLVPEGGWLAQDTAVNKLVAARATDLGGGTAFYDQQVRLEPIDDQGR
ncbi:MAG: hypothetical protein DRI34_08210 [Deltaproteobacteria bacterium]|nr:MAG: hypothetical protein DRI34_08210 [Deltaproteobacteria bacterium]